MNLSNTIFLLIAAHSAFDYALQGDTTAIHKNRHVKDDLSKAVPFYYWMFSHAMVHGGAVFLITNSLLCGIIEVISHGLIDLAKCEKWFNIHVDQYLHLLFKILYIFLLWKV